MDKLQIYYQPAQTEGKKITSLTISYYDFDEKTRTYREKIVLERDGEKYKIKRWLGGLGAILPFVEGLGIKDRKVTAPLEGFDYFYVKHGDASIATSNREEIQDLLKWCHFDDILKYELSAYTKCD